MAEAVFFYTFAGLMLLAALSVILHPRPIYSVLSLLVVMFCLACLFVMLGAYFVAALQVLLYAGAVLVLFLFVIMLLNLAPEAPQRLKNVARRLAGALLAVWVGLQLILVFTALPGAASLPAAPASYGTVESVGRLLFTTYLLPFELTSFLILAAVIGAVTLARQEPPRK